MLDDRLLAADLFARALRVRERSAVQIAAEHFAPGIVFHAWGRTIAGAENVVRDLGTVWPMSPVFTKGIWAPAEVSAEKILISADFGALGAAPRDYRLEFHFDDRDRISRVDESFHFPTRAERQTRIPSHIRSVINSALADGHPLVVAYVTDQGTPSLSLRGSVQVLGEMELCAWIRNATGGLVRAARARKAVSLLYRDSSKRTTLVIDAYARVEEGASERRRIYQLVPEVEQTHDPDMNGAAVVFAIEKIAGTHPLGPVLVQREP
jgi:hypothetical protein